MTARLLLPTQAVTAKGDLPSRDLVEIIQRLVSAVGSGGGGGATDLGYVAATRLLTSSTGTDVTLPLATTLLAGLMSAADKTALAAIPTGGAATLNFGAAPGSSTTTAAVTGQTGIVVGSRVRAWIQGSTADHNAYEHSTILPMMVDLGIGDIVAGTGFTIYASTEMRLTGTIAVKWEWA